MDKICRNSHVGQAHENGSFMDSVASREYARGAFVSHTAMKLDNPERGRTNVTKRATDTFRSQDWFKHQDAGRDTPQDSSVLAPRFWQGHNALSPASSPRTTKFRSSKSQKSLATPFAADESGAASPRSPRVQRARSEAVLTTSIARQASVRTLNSVVEEHFLFSSPRGGRGTSPDAEGRQGDRSPRAHSPTFATSASWMGYSSPRDCLDTDHPPDMMPSSNFAKQTRRLHSGRVSENSDNWQIHHEVSREKPAPPYIANAVTGLHSKGKKTGLHTDENHLKRRLALDQSQDDHRDKETRRAHHFPENLQYGNHAENLRVFSPRVLSPTRAAQQQRAASPDGFVQVGDSKGSRSPRNPEFVAILHRTSPELAASIAPDKEHGHEMYGTAEGLALGVKSPRPPEPRKLMIGNRITSWETGRRPAIHCVQAHHVDQAAGAVPHMPQPSLALQASNVVAMKRDHRNSDVIREHINPIQYTEAPATVVRAMGANGVAYVSAPKLIPAKAAFVRADQRIYSYGEISCLPSNTSKDAGYLASALKPVKYGARMPGAYSPNVPRVPVSQALVGF